MRNETINDVKGLVNQNENFNVYYVARDYGYKTELESVKFSSKENADKFIALMKSEGYEITKFANEGYIGE